MPRQESRGPQGEDRPRHQPGRTTSDGSESRRVLDLVPGRRSRKSAGLGLAGWLLLTLAIGYVGSLASRQASSFYGALVRPAWAPPSSWFGPVWTALYVLMAVAAWLVWLRRGRPGARLALGLFLAQLVPNVLWSWIFFQAQRGGLALLDLALMWALLLATIVMFARVRPLAASLLVPYLAWVTYAGALNLAVWRLNPGVL